MKIYFHHKGKNTSARLTFNGKALGAISFDTGQLAYFRSQILGEWIEEAT